MGLGGQPLSCPQPPLWEPTFRQPALGSPALRTWGSQPSTALKDK